MPIQLTSNEFKEAIGGIAIPICDEIRKVCRDKRQIPNGNQDDWASLHDICALFLAFDLDTAESALPGFQTLPQTTIVDLPEWLSFAQSTGCTDLISRCHELSWLVSQLTKKTKFFVESAHAAIDGYVEVARSIDFLQAATPCFTRLQRAAQLARTLRDDRRAKMVQDAIQHLLHTHASNAASVRGTGCYSLLELLKDQRDLSIADECIKWCTEAAKSCTQQATISLDPSLYMRAGDYNRLKLYWLEKKNNKNLVESTWLEIAQSSDAVSAIYASAAEKNPVWNNTAAHWAHEAVTALKNGKAAPEALAASHARLLLLQKKSMTTMGRFEQTIDTTAIAARARAAIEAHDDPVAALFELATIATPPAASSVAAQLQEVSPLEGMLQRVRVNHDGKSIGGRGGLHDEGSQWHAMVEQMSKWQLLVACGSIGPALSAYCERFLVLESNAQLWVTTAAIVPSGRRDSWVRGLCAGFCGDWSLVIHFLPPQIEHALRVLFEAKGVITSGLQRERQHEFDLNKLLSMAEANEILGVDARLDLAACLAHPLGANLRNYMAHGLLEDEEHASAHSMYLWWLALRMVLLPYLLGTPLLDGEESSPLSPRASL